MLYIVKNKCKYVVFYNEDDVKYIIDINEQKVYIDDKARDLFDIINYDDNFNKYDMIQHNKSINFDELKPNKLYDKLYKVYSQSF